jgi:hypothetical protein
MAAPSSGGYAPPVHWRSEELVGFIICRYILTSMLVGKMAGRSRNYARIGHAMKQIGPRDEAGWVI